jgi:hypothetical protein
MKKTIDFDQLQVLGSMLITVPWISSDWSTDTVYIIIGVSLAILMIGKFILISIDEVHIFREVLKTLKKNLPILLMLCTVRKYRKQFMVSSILPKNEQTYEKMYFFRSFFGRNENTIICFRDLFPSMVK